MVFIDRFFLWSKKILRLPKALHDPLKHKVPIGHWRVAKIVLRFGLVQFWVLQKRKPGISLSGEFPIQKKNRLALFTVNLYFLSLNLFYILSAIRRADFVILYQLNLGKEKKNRNPVNLSNLFTEIPLDIQLKST